MVSAGWLGGGGESQWRCVLLGCPAHMGMGAMTGHGDKAMAGIEREDRTQLTRFTRILIKRNYSSNSHGSN